MLRAETLGEGLRLLIYRAGVKQDVLAEELGVSSASISAYLNDASLPNVTTLRGLARVLASRLDLSPDDVWAALGDLVEATSRFARLDAEAENLGASSSSR